MKTPPHKGRRFVYVIGDFLLFRALRTVFFHLLGQLRHNLEQIADDADIRDVKDRSRRVFVDRDDEIRFFHTGQMLNRAGDTAGDVERRTNGFSGLTDLNFLRRPTGIYRSTGAGDFAAEVAAECQAEHVPPKAVSGAVAYNPILLIIHYHHEVGTKGTLTDYMGGLRRKS